MRKKKEFVEGIDYVITIRKRKKFIKNPKKQVAPDSLDFCFTYRSAYIRGAYPLYGNNFP